MRKRKKMRRVLSKCAGLMVAFSLIVTAFLSGAAPASSLTAQAVQGSEKAAVQESEKAAAEGSEKAAADGSIWDKIKDNLPEIDFSEIDLKAEKEKFREAIRTLDEMGISPEKLAERIWDFLNRKDNKEIIDKTVEDIRDKVENKVGKTADQVTEEITDRASEKVEEAAGQVKEEVKKKAAEEIMDSF